MHNLHKSIRCTYGFFFERKFGGTKAYLGSIFSASNRYKSTKFDSAKFDIVFKWLCIASDVHLR